MRLKAEQQRLYEEIWRTTFGDSDDFIALYSRTTFDPRRTHLLTALDQSHALSHVQYLPYLMRYCDQWWRTGYISGAATESDQRGKGLVQLLMRASHQQMWREDCLCAFLIPAEEWLCQFYRKMGYATLYGKRSTPALQGEPTDLPSGEAWQHYHYWQATLAEQHPTVAHSYHQWRTLLESLALEGGGIGTIGEKTYYYYRDAEGKLQSVLTIPPAEEPADGSFDLSAPFGMLRPLRIAALLTWAAEQGLLEEDQLLPAALYHDEQRIVFDLLDEQIPVNSGRYCILRQRGQLLFAPRPIDRLFKPLTPDQLLVALPSLQHTLVYAMME